MGTSTLFMTISRKCSRHTRDKIEGPSSQNEGIDIEPRDSRARRSMLTLLFRHIYSDHEDEDDANSGFDSQNNEKDMKGTYESGITRIPALPTMTVMKRVQLSSRRQRDPGFRMASHLLVPIMGSVLGPLLKDSLFATSLDIDGFTPWNSPSSIQHSRKQASR